MKVINGSLKGEKPKDKDFTKVKNDFLRYGVEVCGSARNAYFLLLLIMRECGKQGLAKATSQASLGRYMGLSRRGVSRVAGELEKHNLITVQPRWRNNKTYNHYVVHHHVIEVAVARAKQRHKEALDAVDAPAVTS